jgi:hypothetical protein
VMVALAGYLAEGGGTHARYLYPGLTAISLVAAAGLSELPGRRRSGAVLAVVAGQVGLNLLLWATFLSYTTVGRPSLVAAVGQGVRATTALSAGLVVPVVVVLLTAALVLLGRALRILDSGRPTVDMPDPAHAIAGSARDGS